MQYAITVNALNNKNQNEKTNLVGFASVVFGDSFKISNITIRNGQNGLYASMPKYKSKETDEQGRAVYKEICNPTTKEFRKELNDNIIEAFQNLQQNSVKSMVVSQEEQPDGDVIIEEPEFQVKVTPFERENGAIRGLGRIYFENQFVVNNVSLLQGQKGLFVAMPSYQTKQKDKNGNPEYQDICYPVTKEFREKLYGAIQEAYTQALDGQERNGKDGYLQADDKAEVPFR